MTIRNLSTLLTDIRQHDEMNGAEISLGALLDAFHERGFGFFLFLLALPAAVPLPTNVLFAMPLILLTAQQSLGRRTIWVPEKLRSKSLPCPKVHAFIDALMPWVEKLEHFVRPRIGFITHGLFSHLIGASGLIMALCVAIPLPLTHTIPSIGIALMAIGVLMRDGLAVLIGAALGLAWVSLLALAVAFFGIEGFDIVRDAITAFL